MLIKKVFCFLVMVNALAAATKAQSTTREIIVSAFNNAVAMPFSGRAGVVHRPLHPGISLGIAKRINKHDSHQLSLALKFAYLYQQQVQHVIHLYPELQYKYQFDFGLNLRANLGAGYMHSFPNLQQFKLDSNGEYQRSGRGGRPALLSSFTLGMGYNLEEKFNKPISVFVHYQMWFQSPFVKSYVPVLPNTALHVGTTLKINRK